MTIAELLTSQRRWGRTRARKFLMPLLIGENKQLGTLTNRQRRLLAKELVALSVNSSETPAAALDGDELGRP